MDRLLFTLFVSVNVYNVSVGALDKLRNRILTEQHMCRLLESYILILAMTNTSTCKSTSLNFVNNSTLEVFCVQSPNQFGLFRHMTSETTTCRLYSLRITQCTPGLTSNCTDHNSIDGSKNYLIVYAYKCKMVSDANN